MTAHGGRIWVEEAVRGGAAFVVRDPARGGADGGSVKVLVVDDEPQIRRALRTSLEAHGYEVTAVGTGEEGVLGGRRAGVPTSCCSTWGCPTSTAPR